MAIEPVVGKVKPGRAFLQKPIDNGLSYEFSDKASYRWYEMLLSARHPLEAGSKDVDAKPSGHWT